MDIESLFPPEDNTKVRLGSEYSAVVKNKWEVKRRIAQTIKPIAVLEIGVRAGICAACFLADHPNAMYVGLDNDSNSHGGTKGMMFYAENNLKKWFPNAKICIHTVDTQKQTEEAEKIIESYAAFDLVHIDADHTFKGCLNDLVLVKPFAKNILVDDYLMPSVQNAVRMFASEFGLSFKEYASYHGDVLIPLT